ncbi:MAG: SDR family oxidoreductase [Anaerolineae bacterium]|nr:SDR family oxidoreductase [Anaerolineae bacterium]
MRLAIFGATGRTGKLLVAQALEAGHEVVALVRTPSKLAIEDERLSLIQGDVQDPAQVQSAIAGSDAVLSVLGPTSNEPTYEVSRGMANITAAMEAHGVRRLVQSVGAGIRDPRDQPRLFDRLIKIALNLFSRHVYEDMGRTAEIIRASDLDWTLVRVPMLTGDPVQGDLKVGYLGQGVGPRVTRAALAAFMLQQVEDTTYVHEAPVISN